MQSAAGPALPPAPAAFARIAAWAAGIIETVGVAAILIGAALATLFFARDLATRAAFEGAYGRYRTALGRAILLGLEFLIAADIIRTVAVERTFRSLGVLAVIVLVRTFLSFALEVEIEGRWPWERSGRPG